MLRSTKRDLYTVPDLPLKEIIEYYTEIQIPIKPNEILKPTTNSVLRIFDNLLEFYRGENTSDLFIKHRSDPEFTDFEESLYIINLYTRMSEFLRKIGIQSFTLKNITQPETKKLVNILSSIVNFSMYRDNKRDLYERVNNSILERERIKTEVISKIKKVESSLKHLENESSEREKKKIALELELEKLENELRELYKIQRSKTSEFETFKEEKTSLGDKLSSMQLVSLNLKQEIACLKTQIASDPEKLLELLSEMRNMIVKERESLKFLAKRNSNLSQKIMGFTKSIDKMKDLNKLAVSLKFEEKKIEDINKEIQEIELLTKNNESAINTLKIKLGHINRQISHLESKFINLQDNDKKLADEISEKIENLKISYEKISDERNLVNIRALESMKECKHIEFETFKLKNVYDNDLTDLKSKVCDLKDNISRYINFIKQNFSF